MYCKFPYNENFLVFAKKHAGGNGNLIINFAWPKLANHVETESKQHFYEHNRH